MTKYIIVLTVFSCLFVFNVITTAVAEYPVSESIKDLIFTSLFMPIFMAIVFPVGHFIGVVFYNKGSGSRSRWTFFRALLVACLSQVFGIYGSIKTIITEPSSGPGTGRSDSPGQVIRHK